MKMISKLKTLIVTVFLITPLLTINAQKNTKLVLEVIFDNIKSDSVFVINDSVQAYVNLECTSSKVKLKSPFALFTPKFYRMKNMDVYIGSDDVIIRIHENSCEQMITSADKLEKIDDFIILKGNASFSYNKTQIEAGNILVINSNTNKKTIENCDKYFQ